MTAVSMKYIKDQLDVLQAKVDQLMVSSSEDKQSNALKEQNEYLRQQNSKLAAQIADMYKAQMDTEYERKFWEERAMTQDFYSSEAPEQTAEQAAEQIAKTGCIEVPWWLG